MSEVRYVHGGHWSICDRCGFRFRPHQMRKEWTGAMVCSGPGTSDCHEFRHPQEFVKGRADRQAVPNARPDRIPDMFQVQPQPWDDTILPILMIF